MQPNSNPAGLSRRLMAITYDAILLLAVLFCYSMLYTFIIVIASNDISSDIALVGSDDVIYALEPVPLGWPYLAGLVTLCAGFFIYFWKRAGQTLGMKAWKLFLVSTDNKTPSIKQCLIRFFASFLSFGFFGLGYLTLLINRDQGTWHDRLSNTIIMHHTTTTNEP